MGRRKLDTGETSKVFSLPSNVRVKNNKLSSYSFNDLPKTVKYSEVHMYADDTVVFFSSDNRDTIKD